MLVNCGANLDSLKSELNLYLNDAENFSILNDGQIEELSKVHFVDENLRKLAGQNGIKVSTRIKCFFTASHPKSGDACSKCGKKTQ